MEHRIIEINKGDNSHFLIQTKILFFWVNTWIPTGYTLGRLSGPSSDLMLNSGPIKFHSLDNAKKARLMYVDNPYNEIYKGHRIIRVMYEYTREHVFVDINSRMTPYAGRRTRRYGSLEYLKIEIDRLTEKRTKTIVA